MKSEDKKQIFIQAGNLLKGKNNPFHTKSRYLTRHGFAFSILTKGCFQNSKKLISSTFL